MEIDDNALINSTRALLVIFIILICLVNIPLLIKQVRKSKFYQSPKQMMIISLAIGDITLALFPLAVMAKFNFEGWNDWTCPIRTAYTIYYNFLLHFIYGLGLIVLCVEVMTRNRCGLLCSEPVSALLVSGIPWYFGLLIIVPLYMFNINLYNCYMEHSWTLLISVSVFLPASLAVALSIIFNLILRTNQQQQLNNTNLYQGADRHPQNQTGVRSYPHHLQGFILYQPVHQGQSQYEINQLSVIQYVRPINVNNESDRRIIELHRLLIISVIHFVMVIPNAIMTLVWDFSMESSFCALVLYSILEWTMVARSCLTPLIMSCFSDL